MLTNSYLERTIEYDSRVEQVGLINDYKYDLWISTEYEFDAKRSEVVCTSWKVLNSTGDEVSLSKLNYFQVQIVAQALTDALNEQSNRFYHELEENYYGSCHADRLAE